MPKAKKFRCILCSYEISPKEAKKIKDGKCPNCKSSSNPLDTTMDVKIKINWHELRILCMWAERYSVSLDEVSGSESKGNSAIVYWIAERLREQFSELHKKSPLTLADEIRKLKESGYGIHTNMPGIEE